MQRDTKVQLGAALCIVGALAASAALATQLTATAGRAKMAYTDRAEDSDRWEVSLGIAMGSFRGLFVNALWMRANDMKEEGKFYESVELARAITRLQPRFPQVWVFHAWNLAYNISVQTQTPEERWNWVNQGIALLRDEGIPANPNDMLLHKELAWIFLHKIQGYTDDANLFYKRKVAEEWTAVMGPPPVRTVEDNSRERAIEKHVARLREIAEAPAGLGELYELAPQAQGIVEGLREGMGLGLDTRTDRLQILQRVELDAAFMQSQRKFLFERMSGPKTRALRALRADESLAPAWPTFLNYLRRRVLIEDYRMEPERMIRYTQFYGPLDWRHAASHSLYWAARGVEQAKALRREDGSNLEDFDFVNTDRIVAQSVQELFRTGELYFDFKASITGQYALWQGVPNGLFAESYGKVLDDMRDRAVARQGDGTIVAIDAQTRERGFSPLSAGYQNFMVDVCLFFYRRGDRASAEKWLNELRFYADRNIHDTAIRAERFSVDLDEFARRELRDRFTSPSVAINQIAASLMGAYTSGLLGRNDKLFQSQFRFAADWHRYYFEQQGGRTVASRDNVRMAQIDEDFRAVAGTLFLQFMQSIGMSPGVAYSDDAQYAYITAPQDLQVWVYDALVEAFKAQVDAEAKDGGPTFAQLFPEPPGMEAHRQYIARAMGQRSAPVQGVERQ